MDHIVTGALAVVRGANGQNATFYRDALVPDGFGDADHVQHLVRVGLLKARPTAMPAPVLTVPVPPAADEGDDAPSGADGGSPARPPRAAAKGVWVDFAVEQGMDPATAEAMTKEELQAAYPPA